MKHPNDSLEVYEFNLRTISDLFCRSDPTDVCGSCESCRLKDRFDRVRGWFDRASDASQKRFLLGLIQRSKSVDLVRSVARVLLPSDSKDAVYVCSRSFPSLEIDRPTISDDRAVDKEKLAEAIDDAWDWFSGGSYWIKYNFLLVLFKICKSHLLKTVYHQSLRLLRFYEKNDRENALKDDLENSSVKSLEFKISYNDDHLDFTSINETSSATIQHLQAESVIGAEADPNSTSSDILTIRSDISVVSSPVDGFPEELSETKDFVYHLPVHLSKRVLSFLDSASLLNCENVSRLWHKLAREVQYESRLRQNLKKDVYLMQGASVEACNPFYANDIMVAVPNVVSGGWDVVKRKEDEPGESDAIFASAYADCSTRRIIMEERNVYCGPYNVMKVTDDSDPSRVIGIGGGKLIAVGGRDKRIHLIDTESCHQVEPAMSGHAGSIRCLCINENEGYLMSGSFDTSIRKWSLLTKKCLAIYQGHTETVTCLGLNGNLMASGSVDDKCKVWDIESKKCLHTFRHKSHVTCVAISEDLCISGGNNSCVKVWHLNTGTLIKRLNDHSQSITGIVFDRWHIATSSMDGFVFIWSCAGNFSKSLTSLQHPNSVLCLTFKYLRVVTGCVDGKIRIWNIVDGRCLRILRGNSRCDPVDQLSTSNNRLLVNTRSSVLMMTFEPIDYDYTLSSGKMPSRLQEPRCASANRRAIPRSLVRARKMVLSGATDSSIIHHDTSSTRLRKASTANRSGSFEAATVKCSLGKDDGMVYELESNEVQRMEPVSGDFGEIVEDERTVRRTSWAFEHPVVAGASPLSLSETRSLLRSQIRSKAKPKPPDFVSKTMDVIYASLRPSGANENFEVNPRVKGLIESGQLSRPKSSPGLVDPRTKVPITQTELDRIRMTPVVGDSAQPDCGDTGLTSEAKDEILLIRERSVTSLRSKTSTPLASKYVRPHTATVVRSICTADSLGSRPKSSVSDSPWKHRKGGIRLNITTTSPFDVTMVPMLMFSKQSKNPESGKERNWTYSDADGDDIRSPKHCREISSPYDDPLKSKLCLNLLTNQQSVEETFKVDQFHKKFEASKELSEERSKKVARLKAIKNVAY